MDLAQWVDETYMISIRRELHQYPELAFDLPKTRSIVKRELDKMKLSYSEAYGPGSLVAFINEHKTNFTIGIRADMDALPVVECNDVPYRSKIEGQMHACGHDAHTAILLGTAMAFNQMRDQIKCRIALIFQPSEEGQESGARKMVEAGVMEEIDLIIGLHVENDLPVGTVGICPGFAQAASRTIQLLFSGKSAHAALPHTGIDALAMAIRTYVSIQMVLTRELDPQQRYLCSFGKLTSGTTQNVVPESSELLGTIRTYDAGIDQYILKRIRAIADHTAQETGGQAAVQTNLKCLPVYNSPKLSQSFMKSAEKVVGPERVQIVPSRMSSEDFSFYLKEKPGILFRLGTGNPEKGCIGKPHHGDFQIDEDALAIGCKIFLQFVLDYMYGIPDISHEVDLSSWHD